MAPKNANAAEPTEGQITLFPAETGPDPFRKAVQVVHSTPQAPMTLLQRKLANQWIKNALETKADADEWFTIPIRTMLPDIGYDSNNRAHIIKSARELMKITFDWDVIAPANKKVLWKASVLFPEVEIEAHLIRYQISKQVRERVLDPLPYAVIDMNVVRNLRRAASIALYENCVRYENIGHTTEAPWTTYRDIILGKSDKNPYPQYKQFKDKVLKPCLAEINGLPQSKILLELRERKEGRTISSIWFDIKPKEQGEREDVDNDEQLKAVGEMIRLGVPQSEARRLLKQNSLESVRAAIDFTRKRVADTKQKKIDSPAAYFRSALQKGWAQPQEAAAPRIQKAHAEGEDALDHEYALHRIKEAEKYFKELLAPEQTALMMKYNGQQLVANLRIGKKKDSHASRVAFFGWLAKDTWGEVTSEALLAFARQKLTKMS